MAALCYAEFAAMIPIAGSAYSYSYTTMGELVGWIIGWDLILEYAVGGAAVAVGWSGYFNIILNGTGIHLPNAITHAPGAGGLIDLPALLIILLISGILYVGISESARVTSIISDTGGEFIRQTNRQGLACTHSRRPAVAECDAGRFDRL